MEKTIAPEFTLPCDFVVGSMIFRKGVKLETLRVAAERWFQIGADAMKPVDAAALSRALEETVAKITDENRHPAAET